MGIKEQMAWINERLDSKDLRPMVTELVITAMGLFDLEPEDPAIGKFWRRMVEVSGAHPEAALLVVKAIRVQVMLRSASGTPGDIGGVHRPDVLTVYENLTPLLEKLGMLPRRQE